METELVLRRYRDVPGFVRSSLRVKKHLKRSDGVEQFRVGANLFRRRFTTTSTWVDNDALQRFVGSGAHRQAMREVPATTHTRFQLLPANTSNDGATQMST
jgi:hypothetical protein